MTPNITSEKTYSNEITNNTENSKNEESTYKSNNHPIKLLWIPIISFGSLHVAAIYATYLIFTSANIWTTIFGK